MPQPKTITIDNTEYIRKDSVKTTTYKPSKKGPWELGKAYFILTVTQGLHGILVEVTEHELVLMDAAWIADTSRFNQFVAGLGEPNEVECYPRNTAVVVGRGALISAVKLDRAFDVSK